jgi:hypothetical protein
MMMMGSWWLKSKKDERWNASGTGRVGDFQMPPGCVSALEELTKLYGTPPDDLEYGYMKD